jgi:hypothetical protein
MKRTLLFFSCYLFIVCIIFGGYAIFDPPPGKTSLEMLYNFSLVFIFMMASIATIVGGLFSLQWLVAKCSNAPVDFNKIVYDETPDSPVSFGYKCLWIAVKSPDTEQIADRLTLKNRTPCNWKAGIENGYLDGDESPVFLSPPVRGWSLLVGRGALPNPETHHDELVELLNRLSETFGEACFFGTMRITEFAAWFRSKEGQMIRKFLFAGDVIYDEGERIGIESEVAYTDYDYDSNKEKTEKRDEYCGDEDWVMQIAADWSLDPTKLHRHKKTSKAVGILGYLSEMTDTDH